MKAALFATLLAVASAVPPKHHQLDGYNFEQYMQDYNKGWTGAEMSFRKGLFTASLDRVRIHNALEGMTWKMGINQFSDMTEAEIKAFKGRSNGHFNGRSSGLLGAEEAPLGNLKAVSELPGEVDWRTTGVTTPVKNQGGCGSCWAFSATAVLESHVAIATGKLMRLSPQQLVSCAPNPGQCGGQGGCLGATQWIAFNYTIGAGGLSLDKRYKYEGKTGECLSGKIEPRAGIKDYVRLPPNNYTSLMNAVATRGPIAISVDASWSHYESGVYNSPCGTTIDHAVVLEGYGTSEDGQGYYLVRNSWGPGWGEDGYIRIKRNENDSDNCAEDTRPADGTACKPYPKEQKVCGLCGILSDSSYPTGGFLIPKEKEPVQEEAFF